MEVRNDGGVGNFSPEDHAHEQSSPAPSKQVKSSPNTVDTNSVTQRSFFIYLFYLISIFIYIYLVLE